MFSYGRNNFTWNGTLRELEGSWTERGCPRMSVPLSSSSGLEVLLSTLQNAGDVESTLNILNVLDELLSAGTDRRIHYMIRKGGSEALLAALVNAARSFTPNYSVLLPLLHLLVKVGQRDRRIGVKAEDAGAVLLTLSLLRHSQTHPRRAAACLWVLQVFSSSVCTANLIGENHGLEVIYRLITPYTNKHLHTIKAAITALTALLSTKANVSLAVSKGFVGGLLQLFEDWFSNDSQHEATAICHALLRCLLQVTHRTAGRQAVLSQGGLRLLYQTTQACLMTKGRECLVEPSVQLMRKCLPRTPLPLTSDQSVYTFSLPGGSHDAPKLNIAPAGSSEDEEDLDDEDADSRAIDDDLETDLNKLRLRPEPDRPRELLTQYSRLCPELSHDFQELNLSSGSEDSSSSSSSASSSSDEEMALPTRSSKRHRRRMGNEWSPSSSGSHSETDGSMDGHTSGSAAGLHHRRNLLSTSPSFRSMVRETRDDTPSGERGSDQVDEEEVSEDSHHCTMIHRLLERHGTCIPHHNPRLYWAAASKTRSIPGFSILAFPDFWGHLPPQGPETMAPRRPHVQRLKVFEDIRRFLNTDDIINQVVFDLEDSSVECPSDSLRFHSKFESGNLRKALQIRRYEYDLILNADTNCCQHTQWFYFEVSNMEADVQYRFNIINCEKTNSQFNYGMQPVLYSVREALEGRPHWVRTGADVCYFRNHFCSSEGQRTSTFYTLTFTVTFRHQEDVCYIAYHYPYTYSALKAHLKVLQKSLDHSRIFFRQQVLCGTLNGNSCPLVTITACPSSRSWRDLHQLRNRPCIVLTARVHPGESNASWVMKGSLEFLCSSDPVAQSLREAFIFKIIPMLNPDGVINGMSRCDLNGEDLNRQWCKPDPSLCPTIYHAKGFLYYLNSIGHTPQVFCDYHGHSRKKNVFLYGCSMKETLWQSGSAVDTMGLKEDPGYRTIPKTLDRIAPAFSFNSCNYLVEKSRSSTARVVVWREMGVLRSYTMESTYNGCDQGVYKGLQTGTRELQDMGLNFCQSLLSVTKDCRVLYHKKLIQHIDLDHNILDHKSHNCFEDDEPPCVEEIEFSADCPPLHGDDLDTDVNRNMVDTEDEDDEEEDEHRESKSLRSCMFPQSKKRNTCNRVSIANRQIIS